jgi:hypothetical protein
MPLSSRPSRRKLAEAKQLVQDVAVKAHQSDPMEQAKNRPQG